MFLNIALPAASNHDHARWVLNPFARAVAPCDVALDPGLRLVFAVTRLEEAHAPSIAFSQFGLLGSEEDAEVTVSLSVVLRGASLEVLENDLRVFEDQVRDELFCHDVSFQDMNHSKSPCFEMASTALSTRLS